jgi:ribosomal-protein-alanine N-acetyltransferase
LRILSADDYEPWTALRGESRQELEPLEAWAPDELSLEKFEQFVHIGRTSRRHYAIHARWQDSEEETLAGGVYLSHFLFGTESACRISYWVGTRLWGLGIGTAAVSSISDEANKTFRRVEAFVLPENPRSQTVLHRCGFVREGLVRENIFIGGAWRDHYLYAKLYGG